MSNLVFAPFYINFKCLFFHTILHYHIFNDIVEHSWPCANRSVPNSIKTIKDTHMKTCTQIKKTQLQNVKI